MKVDYVILFPWFAICVFLLCKLIRADLGIDRKNTGAEMNRMNGDI